MEIEYRGKDATGYAYPTDDGVMIHKEAKSAWNFLKTAPLFEKRAKKKMPDTLLIHTRHATQGSPKNNGNNHPIFSKGSGLCFIHNGWLLNEDDVLKNHPELDKDAEVDSETVLKLTDIFLDKGTTVTKAVRKAMAELRGAFACAMISQKYPNTLWLWKRGNPLWTAITEDKSLFIWASTKAALQDALRAVGMDKGVKLAEFPEKYILQIGPNVTRLRKLPAGPSAPAKIFTVPKMGKWEKLGEWGKAWKSDKYWVNEAGSVTSADSKYESWKDYYAADSWD